MIPYHDENETRRTPIVTMVLIAACVLTWIFVQGAGAERPLAASVCNLGLIPGELTGSASPGARFPMGEGLVCVVDPGAQTTNILTSMFLHGSWGHILGNALFFWVFGNNIEDSMGGIRFVLFYLLCGLAAVGAHIAVQPASPVPTVGASGVISGVLGAYLVLYPRVRVNMLFWFLFFIRVIPLPAWLVLIWWFGIQVITGLPELSPLRNDVSGGVAVWAHVGGFVAGVVLVKVFESKRRVEARVRASHSPFVGYGA